MTIFRCLEAMEGTFIRIHMSQSCLGCIFEIWNAKNANIDLNMSILPMCRVGNVYVQRVNRVVFSTFGPLEGTFVSTHMRQSCLGCIVEGFV